MNKGKNIKIIRWFIGVVVSLVSILAFIFFFPAILLSLTGLSFPESAGEFGDMYGVLNTFFTGLAFMGLIITIFFQRKELALQREDLKRQADEFETQSRLSEIQQFNSFFFHSFNNIVNLKKDINSISINYEYNPEIKGNTLDLIFLIIRDYMVEYDKNNEYNTITISQTIKKFIPKITPLIKSLHITTNLTLKNKHLSEEQVQNYLDMIFGIFTEEEARAVDFFWRYLNYDLIENLEYRKNIIPYSGKEIIKQTISNIKNSPTQIAEWN